jgi:GNAT superfamily N-acetyltransferase
VEITFVPADDVRDDELEQLLGDVYVAGGFTDAAAATSLFAARAVRARGNLIAARDGDRVLAGMIVVAPPGSPARRLAAPHEVELHLLAVRAARRAAGLGRMLVEAALAEVRRLGLCQVVLWTQPTMHAAHRLYERCGFARAPVRDFTRDTREFRVYELELR